MHVRLTDEEERGFKLAAKLAGMGVSTWARGELRSIAAAQLREHKLPVPFLPAPPASPTKPRKPLPPGHFYEDEMPSRPVPDERLPFEAWIRPYTNGGQKFPEADEELGGHWCFAILLARDCYDPAIYEEIEAAYRTAWHEGKTPGPDETP